MCISAASHFWWFTMAIKHDFITPWWQITVRAVQKKKKSRKKVTYSCIIQLIIKTSASLGGSGHRKSSALEMAWWSSRNVTHCFARLGGNGSIGARRASKVNPPLVLGICLLSNALGGTRNRCSPGGSIRSWCWINPLDSFL